jgi:hypothetical protein
VITLRLIRPSDINAIVSLTNRKLWQRHSGVDEWYSDPVKETNLVSWERLTLYQKYLHGGVGCDPILYKNHLNWITRNGGFVIAAEETVGVMKRIVAFAEIWCAEEPAPMGKTGSIITLEVDTNFTEDPVPKLYANAKKEIRARGYSTLAICHFSSRAVAANLDDSRWELLGLTRRYRIAREALTPCELPHSVEEVAHGAMPVHELFCVDQSVSPLNHWSSVWEEFELLPEMKRSVHRSKARKVNIEYHGRSIVAVIWAWTWGDVEDYWRLSIWVPADLEEDRELIYELARIAAQTFDADDIPGFDLCADEENGSFLVNRGFKVDEEKPAEPRYYTGV